MYNIFINFIQQGCIKLIKTDSKDIYNITNDKWFPQILSSTTVFKTDNKMFWALNRHISIISEGSCDIGVRLSSFIIN